MTSLASCRREVKVGGWGGCHCHLCLGCWWGAHGVLFSGSELLQVSAKPSGRSCGAPPGTPPNRKLGRL